MCGGKGNCPAELTADEKCRLLASVVVGVVVFVVVVFCWYSFRRSRCCHGCYGSFFASDRKAYDIRFT